jgi:hypothetical protein
MELKRLTDSAVEAQRTVDEKLAKALNRSDWRRARPA